MQTLIIWSSGYCLRSGGCNPVRTLFRLRRKLRNKRAESPTAFTYRYTHFEKRASSKIRPHTSSRQPDASGRNRSSFILLNKVGTRWRNGFEPSTRFDAARRNRLENELNLDLHQFCLSSDAKAISFISIAVVENRFLPPNLDLHQFVCRPMRDKPRQILTLGRISCEDSE